MSGSHREGGHYYGEPWIKTEWSSIFWFSRSLTVGLLYASFANCCMCSEIARRRHHG
jgi:hypothetical protein